MDLTTKEIAKELKKNLQLNANRISCKQCYAMCANKQKLDYLLRDENQVVMGRRGTGKTTIFKAFSFYVNKISNIRSRKAWYVSLDECVPSSLELVSDSADDVSVYIFKSFLKKLIEFFYHNLDKLEKNRSEFLKYQDSLIGGFYDTVTKLNKLIIELDDLIEGSPQEKTHKLTHTEELENVDNREVGFNLKKNLDARVILGWKRGRNKHIIVKNSKEYLFKLDVSSIRQTILDIFKLFGYKKVYICLDEFNLIDRRTNVSLQARFAQLLKELFFGSSMCVVKIANVWNESRMQSKQGLREGLELGQDIFWTQDLDLDTMFEHDNNKANDFFVNMIVNDYLLGERLKNPKSSIPENSSQCKILGDMIIDKMFAKDAFSCLVCGSQGIPRIFGEILSQCIKKIEEEQYEKKINVDLVCESIISNYNINVRRAIPYDSILYTSIDDYLNEKLTRFFLVRISDYNRGKKYFDSLVATNALHQCPSEQVPRKIKNRYKVFFVHYGNYLEAVGNQLKEIQKNTKENSMLLYPDFPEDITDNLEKYLLNIPNHAFDYLYCDDCHEYFEIKTSQRNNIWITCPKCNKRITYWR